MLAAAQQLLDCATLAPHPVPDLVGGEAGATLGLLACAAVFGEGVNLERAAECGARLAARVSTLFGDVTAQRPDDALTGLSHGASGMAVALAEIDNARPDRSLTRAQEHALRFERHHFSPIDGNWPDFRHPEVNGIKHYGSAWCHGAPGIALARLRLRQFGATNADLEVEARTALGATAEFTSRALHSGRYNTSLCHGLAGNAEILWQGRDLDLSHGSLACEVAAEVARRFTGRQIGWPCPMPGGEHPGLMVGLAGTALFYLRLHAPSLPSLLLLRPDEWLATSTA